MWDEKINEPYEILTLGVKKHGYCQLSCQVDTGTESVDADTKWRSCTTSLVYKMEKLLRFRNNFLERRIKCIHLSIDPWIFQSSFQGLPHSMFPWLCTWTEEGSRNARQSEVQRKAPLKAEQSFQPSAVPSQSFESSYTADRVSNKSWHNFCKYGIRAMYCKKTSKQAKLTWIFFFTKEI